MRSTGIAFTKYCWVYFIASAIFAWCPSAQAIENDALRSDPERSALSFLLKEHDVVADTTSIDWQRLNDFYRRRDMRLAWTETEPRDLALRTLEDAAEQGLSPTDYHIDALRIAVRKDADQLARYDVLLSDGLLRYAHDVRIGRLAPADVDADVALPSNTFDVVGAVANALQTGELSQLLATLPPAHPQYAQLRAMLVRYRAFASGTAWPYLPDKGRIALDASDPRQPDLVKRLEDEGYFSGDSPSAETIRAGVLAFQRAHGLEADGRVGSATLRALNVSAAGRVAQIEANMERWRWLPRTLEPRRIEVNVPDASLRAFEHGAAVLFSRIIVGTKDRPTPVVRTTATGLVVNPPWDVPMEIARREILPKLARKRDYLSKHHMVLLKPGVIRQLPGPDNALGQLKLDMPNRFSVYLHDTPVRTLFARTDRDLSHGCMRVEQILPLGSFALTGDPGSAVDQLKQAIATQSTQRIALPAPVPVYVVYNTAWVDWDGSVQFREDLYGRDQRLIALLKGQSAGRRYAMATPLCLPACG